MLWWPRAASPPNLRSPPIKSFTSSCLRRIKPSKLSALPCCMITSTSFSSYFLEHAFLARIRSHLRTEHTRHTSLERLILDNASFSATRPSPLSLGLAPRVPSTELHLLLRSQRSRNQLLHEATIDGFQLEIAFPNASYPRLVMLFRALVLAWPSISSRHVHVSDVNDVIHTDLRMRRERNAFVVNVFSSRAEGPFLAVVQERIHLP